MKTFGHTFDRVESPEDASQNRLESDLIARIGTQRDAQAFTTLCTTYSKSAFNLAYYITGNKSLAEEAVQDAMLDIWQSASKFKPGPARGWILKIVARRSLKKFNRSAQIKTREQQQVESVPVNPCVFNENAEGHELMLALQTELHALPPGDRQLVGLFYSGTYTQDEISKALDIPQSTVSFRLRKILKHLKCNLTQAGYASVGMTDVNDLFIRDVLLNVHEVCPEWQSNLLTETKSRVTNYNPPSIKKDSKAVSPMTLALCAIALGAVILTITVIAKTPFKKNAQAPNIENKSNVVHAKRSMLWDFNSRREVKAWNSEFAYFPSLGIDKSGAILVPPKRKTHWIFDFPRWRLPLKITCRYQFPPKTKATTPIRLMWRFPKQLCKVSNFGTNESIQDANQEAWTTFTGYVTDTSIDLWVNNRRFLLFFCKPGSDEDQLSLGITNYREAFAMDNLTTSEVSISEIPDLSKFSSLYLKLVNEEKILQDHHLDKQSSRGLPNVIKKVNARTDQSLGDSK